MSKNKKFSLAEVTRHHSKQDLYIIQNKKVYNVTPFIDQHPGGEEVILEFAGKDATEAFEEVGHSKNAQAQLAELQIGVLDSDSSSALNDTQRQKKNASGAGLSSIVLLYGLVIAVGAVAFGGYRYVYRILAREIVNRQFGAYRI